MDKTKTPFHLLDFNFLEDMAENMRKGLRDGRKPDGWYEIEPTFENISEYFSATLRHLIAGMPSVDGRPGDCDAFAAVACNAMILSYLVEMHRLNNEKVSHD